MDLGLANFYLGHDGCPEGEMAGIISEKVSQSSGFNDDRIILLQCNDLRKEELYGKKVETSNGD